MTSGELLLAMDAEGVEPDDPVARVQAEVSRAEYLEFGGEFVGKDELDSGRYGLKDLRSGKQEQIDEAGLVARLRTEEHGRA